MAVRGVDMHVDFSGIEDVISRVQGIGDAAHSPQYIDDIIKVAHNVAALEFDIDMAASASLMNLSHVYEFGVRGITRGDPKFNDPTDPAARLYVHGIQGNGRTQQVFFTFRPAVVPNPRPSARYFGVESEVINRLSRRKYLFWNKARVIEYGLEVAIKPNRKPFNFVPFYGEAARNPAYQGRTHIFRPIEGNEPMYTRPGVESGMRGTFTAFWQSWWTSRGEQLVGQGMNDKFTDDVRYLLNRYPAEKGGLQSVVRYNSRGRVYNRRRYYKNRMIAKAEERKRVNRLITPRR